MRSGAAVVPERLADLRVALVGYRETDGAQRTEKVDIIDVRALHSVVSLPPSEAVILADQLREVAGRTVRGNEPGA